MLAVVVGAVILYTHKLKYEAKALISIESRTPFIAFEKDKESNQSDRFVETQVELLRSAVVLGPVLAEDKIVALGEFNGLADPLDYLQDHLSINQIGKSELYDIRYVGSSPPAAAQIVNAIIAEYLKSQSDEDFLQDPARDRRARGA